MCLQIEIKRFLESVYGLKVEAVHTVSYEGKRKRRKQGFFRESDYKKVSSCSAAHMHPTPSHVITQKLPHVCHAHYEASKSSRGHANY